MSWIKNPIERHLKGIYRENFEKRLGRKAKPHELKKEYKEKGVKNQVKKIEKDKKFKYLDNLSKIKQNREIKKVLEKSTRIEHEMEIGDQKARYAKDIEEANLVRQKYGLEPLRDTSAFGTRWSSFTLAMKQSETYYEETQQTYDRNLMGKLEEYIEMNPNSKNAKRGLELIKEIKKQKISLFQHKDESTLLDIFTFYLPEKEDIESRIEGALTNIEEILKHAGA